MLLQIGACVITNWGSSVITNRGKSYYKLGQVLQIGAELLQVGVGITNRGNYYKSVQNNMHGKVERKIKHVKESFAKHLYNNRLSIIQWETLGHQVSNIINNLPMALRSVTNDQENIDVITPNRLLLARKYRCYHS